MNFRIILSKIWRKFTKLTLKPVFFLSRKILNAKWIKVKRHHNYRLFFIDHTRKLIYVENPKAASRSILDAMESSHFQGRVNILNNVPQPSLAIALPSIKGRRPRILTFSRHGLSHENRDWLKQEEIDTYYKFTFVRNPFDRVVSGYTNKVISSTPIGVPQKNKNISWENFLGGRISDLNNETGFKNFINKYLTEFDDKRIDVHFKKQSVMVEQYKENFLDFVGKVENFEEDWKKIADKFNFQKQQPGHLNKSGNKKDCAKYYADKESVELVHDRYKEDIEKYGYEQNYRELLSKYA